MYKLFRNITITLIFVAGVINFASAQLIRMNNRMVIAGIVVDAETEASMPYVNVYVKHTRTGTITDTAGYFVLFVNIGDTIIFSSIGYEKLHVLAIDTLGDISRPAWVRLKRKVYELQTVDIIALRRYEQFKYEFTTMVLPENDYTHAARNFPVRPPELDYYTRQGASGFGLIFSPISALYDAFSKEGKERRKLEEIEEQDALKKEVAKKYNPAMVMRITGLNEPDAIAFMNWCQLPDRLILNATEYQIIEIIMMQFDKYNK
ncbi:MAG: carboxypeptidase-like regulatory domain-containing protein [Bacteroidales bacterium]|nr:carboxypeptidase-like regulatory domain-containing protein [Bacteroidales bacterium]HOY37785.1 carboxypeptidase-like regulatory domain-containing protein [Bacteroidales bacterium]HQP03569.1 carboxypeptidase-like regulatory domain-containing protein [Bacteroidales bacterium]